MKTESDNRLKFCFLYFLGMTLFVLILIVNYLITYDAFSENKIVYLDPNKVCKEFVFSFNECLSGKYQKLNNNNSTANDTEKGVEMLCSVENERVLYCFDCLKGFNKRCEIYLSEYSLCRKNNLRGENCSEILNDLKTCNIWTEYITVNANLLDFTYWKFICKYRHYPDCLLINYA